MTASDASKATTESTFLQHMDKLKDIKMPSWRELNAKPHELWTNYADRGNMTWNESKSIMSEGVNKIVDDEVIVCMCVCVCVWSSISADWASSGYGCQSLSLIHI